MANLTPYSGSSAQRLTAVINKDNHKELRLGADFTFGLPIDFEEIEQRVVVRNTQVLLVPVFGTRYHPEYVFYERLTLQALYDLPEGYIAPVVVPPGSFYIHDILDSINAALGLNLAADEVVNAFFEEELDAYPLHTLNDVCLAWLDSDFTFTVNRDGTSTPIPLTQAIPNNVLSGLIYHPGE